MDGEVGAERAIKVTQWHPKSSFNNQNWFLKKLNKLEDPLDKHKCILATCDDILPDLAPPKLVQGPPWQHLIHIPRYKEVLKTKTFSDLEKFCTSGPRLFSFAQLLTALTP